MWTVFYDMSSGGTTKEPPYDVIIIEGPEDEAADRFVQRFGHSPYDVACPCCGSNYGLLEFESIEKAKEIYHGNTLIIPKETPG